MKCMKILLVLAILCLWATLANAGQWRKSQSACCAAGCSAGNCNACNQAERIWPFTPAKPPVVTPETVNPPAVCTPEACTPAACDVAVTSIKEGRGHPLLKAVAKAGKALLTAPMRIGGRRHTS